ncbi:unnamed protein product [Soboliphyme baturini]|uniref:Mannosyltransferase n=1 Tax=Soboliphyme baturini TaxID=241478 RepID=A0A183IUS0_9BILA|nr:unnamed protein product [Soboliphyme baturini]
MPSSINGPWLFASLLTCLYVYLCPCTKVEESFNIQAVHDLLFYGTNITEYDHREFPGVVPRSFIGALALCLVSYPFVVLTVALGLPKFYSLILVRSVLGLTVCAAFRNYATAVEHLYGPSVTRWLFIVTVTQFHFLFYASRTLPNTFALVLVLESLSALLRRKYDSSIFAAATAVFIFRSELVLLFTPLFLFEIISRQLSVFRALKVGVLAALFCLSVVIDSFFWERCLWPEGEVWWYNVVLNKSKIWGTMPFLWYFYSALPRSLGVLVLFVPLGLWINRSLLKLVLAAVVFVSLYSFLPHKELRFIIYTVPIFNLACACAASALTMTVHKAVLFLALIVNCLMTLCFLFASYHNYPGGSALRELHFLQRFNNLVKIHIDVYCAETGVSRFLQQNDKWHVHEQLLRRYLPRR